jgi:hypothetical protein
MHPQVGGNTADEDETWSLRPIRYALGGEPVASKCVTAATMLHDTRVYPKVSGLATWSENCKWYRSLPLGIVVSLFCESV